MLSFPLASSLPQSATANAAARHRAASTGGLPRLGIRSWRRCTRIDHSRTGCVCGESGFPHWIAHNREFSRNGDRIAPMQQNLHDDNPHRPALFLIDWQ